MKDHMGSRVRPGDLVLWRAHAMVCKVLEVDDGGIQLGKSGQITGPKVKLELTLLLDPQPGQPSPVLVDFYRIVDPQSDRLIDELSGTGVQ